MISGIECTLHPKIFKGKMHGRSLTEPIRFKVTSGIKVSRVKKKLGSIFEVSARGRDVAVVKTGDMRWEVKCEGEKNHKKGGLNCVFGNFFFYVLDNCPQVQSLK